MNETRDIVLAGRLVRARSLAERLRGLLGREALPAGEGLLIEPCRSIHTFFMRFPIDAVFLSRDGRVLRILRNLLPFRISSVVWRAASVLELPAGTLTDANVRVGDKIRFREAA